MHFNACRLCAKRVCDVLVAAVPDAAQLPARAHVGPVHTRRRHNEEALSCLRTARAPVCFVCWVLGHRLCCTCHLACRRPPQAGADASGAAEGAQIE
jgi:hypothetical protein